ncbi:antibiotic biosynthesis monooxygenase subfamily protein [Acanthamoeba castellanii str. Neff]|uniref:Antibiotic biosynthesis monooxygenase subfamily protein n=1 Tax=Acanthamoeba castellanii (strain ATCC 30010 / Neff) TaxID=1257118 RepID=L8GI68_ACACF|nr:antibiotic biosynthesis monooxygenase subfamily protein [Acanthamoeba castellanii str. Neff]ELR12652.1 antibiotic biosynthesis monooxygenase subfamily protein [Acanthamoeba castellanii str. Neff]
MARPGFVRTNIVRWVKEGSEASFLSQMRDLRRLALNADGFIGSEHLWSVEHKHKHLTTQTWTSLDAWHRFKSHPDRVHMVKKLQDHLTEEPLEDVYTPYVKERFSIDLEALQSGRHGN